MDLRVTRNWPRDVDVRISLGAALLSAGTYNNHSGDRGLIMTVQNGDVLRRLANELEEAAKEVDALMSKVPA